MLFHSKKAVGLSHNMSIVGVGHKYAVEEKDIEASLSCLQQKHFKPELQNDDDLPLNPSLPLTFRAKNEKHFQQFTTSVSVAVIWNFHRQSWEFALRAVK